MTLRRISTIATLALGAMLLSGCSANTGAAHPTATTDAPSAGPVAPTSATPTSPSTSSATPGHGLASVDTIRLNAETVDLLSGADKVSTLPLSDTSDDSSGTLATLNALLGDPRVTVTQADPQQVCTIPNTRYDWNDQLILVRWTSGDPAGFDVRLLSDHFQNPTSGGGGDGGDGASGGDGGGAIALTATGDVAVGDDIGDLIAVTPADLIDTWSADGVSHHTVILQQGYRSRPDTTGVAAFTDGDVVTTIGTPVPVHSNADC